MGTLKFRPQGQDELVVQVESLDGTEVLETRTFAPGEYRDIQIPMGFVLRVWNKADYEESQNGADAGGEGQGVAEEGTGQPLP